jgi:hypothetical protein
MKSFHWRFFLITGLGMLAVTQSQGGAAFGQRGYSSGSCGTVNGSADLKEGGAKGQRAQYWINGFPGKGGPCQYTLEICFNGDGKEIGAKAFITKADGGKLQSADHIKNCNGGWSHFFDGAVAGAQEILVATESGVSLNVRFTAKSQYGGR